MNAHYKTDGPSDTLLVLGGVFMALLGIFCGGVLTWLLIEDLRKYEWIAETLPALFVWSKGVGIMVLSPVAAIACFLLSFMAFKRFLTQNKKLSKEPETLEKVVAVLSLVAAIGMPASGFVGKFYWDNSFRQASYVRCSNSFMLTSKWLMDVWVRNPAYCRDPEVRAMMASPRHGIDDINEYLRDQER